MAAVRVFPYEKLKPYVNFLTFSNNKTFETNVYDNPLGNFNYFLATFYVLLLIGGLIGNTWAISVIVSLFKSRSREPPRNVQLYILVLCVIDIFVLASMPLTITDAIFGQWTFESSLACKFYLCSELLNKFFAPFILMALSGTCYMVVCRRQCRDFSDDLRAGFSIAILSAGVLIVLMTPVYIYGDLNYVVMYENKRNGTSLVKFAALKCMFQMEKEDKESISGRARSGISDFILYTFLVGYVLPATAFTIFYILLWRFVRQHSWRARSLVNSWRVARTVLGLISFFLLCWSPYWIFLLYSNAKPQYRPADRSLIALAFAYLTHLLPYINCLGYPLIYIILNRKIKENYELIKAKRRSQILALCGLRKEGRSRRGSRRTAEPTETRVEVSNNILKIVAKTIETNEITEAEEFHVPASSLGSRYSRDADAAGDAASGSSGTDSQSLFANVNELLELSRHLLIPLIQINDAEPGKKDSRNGSIEVQPDSKM